MMYADETGEAFTTLANNIGVVSMGAGSITTLKCEQFVGYSQMYTIPDAVAMLKPKRIIIGFGTNNLSGQSTNADSFIETYLKGLEAIREAWPYADIIVNAIPPLDKQRENQNLYMVQVDAYNAALAEMCEENGFKFLNSAEVLKDPDTGWAKKDYTLSDGVHLSKTAVTAFFEYVRTHAYVTEDRRPQPLGNIPEPAGTPVGLISQDPIAVRGAKVPRGVCGLHRRQPAGRHQPAGQKGRYLLHRHGGAECRLEVCGLDGVSGHGRQQRQFDLYGALQRGRRRRGADRAVHTRTSMSTTGWRSRAPARSPPACTAAMPSTSAASAVPTARPTWPPWAMPGTRAP